MKKPHSDSESTQKNLFLRGVVSQTESIWARRGQGYPTKNELIETPTDRHDWITIAQYIMTNSGQDSAILRKANGHNVPAVIEFFRSFDYVVPNELYEKGTKRGSTPKNKINRKTLYQILLSIVNSFRKKQKNSLNRDDIDMLFGLLDPESIHRPKNPLYIYSEVIGHTKGRVDSVLGT